MNSEVARYFAVTERKSTIHRELMAGLATFLSVSYIFVVSPSILSASGIEPQAAFFATAVAATLATFAMGLWANLPFAVAPGLTMSSYFSFVVVQQMGFTWQQALATVFLSGVLCFLLTALPVRRRLIASIPLGLKRAIATMVGVFVAAIGLLLTNLIAPGDPLISVDPSALLPSENPLIWVFLTGLLISVALGNARLNLPGGTILAVIAATLVFWYGSGAEAGTPPAAGTPLSALGQLDFSIFASAAFVVPVLVFFVLDFFEGVGEFIGLTAHTSIQDREGNVPNMEKGLYVDGVATTAGSLLGTSSLIIFVESAVGIKAGGRTGLTAVACGALMAIVAVLGYFFSSVLLLVPAAAASGVLVYVGFLLFQSSVAGIRDAGLTAFDIVVSIVMGAAALLTFSLDMPLAFGFWAYFLHRMVYPLGDRISALWLGLIALLLTYVSFYEFIG